MTLFDDLAHDIRYALRVLRRTPTFSAAVISTLALGIGASTAIFSVAYGVILRPLPYPDPDRLIRIYETHAPSGWTKQDVSVGTFDELRQRAGTLESAALMEDVRISHLADANQQPVRSLSVSPSFFQTLGVAPLLGRGFKSEDAYRASRADEIVLSYGAWQRLFAGRQDVIGKPLQFWRDDDRWLIVGVMPRDFAYGPSVDVWRPEIVPPRIGSALRNLRQADVVARVRPGASMEQARTELDAIAAHLAREFPTSNRDWGIALEPLHTAFIGNFSQATWLLLAAVAVVFLVACVNAAGLLLARAIAREHETRVREALGATRWRLVRLWLGEAWLLTGLGTGIALLLAWWSIHALRAAAPPGIPRVSDIKLDTPVLAMMATCATTAVAIIGILAVRSPQWRRQRHAGNSLLLVQCAGAAALVILAVMLSRSLTLLISLDLGWNPAGIVSMNILPEFQGRTRDRYLAWVDQLLTQLRTRPEIHDAALTTQIPLSTLSYSENFAPGTPDANKDGVRWSGVRHAVTDGYFELMGMRLVEGRAFDARDRFNPSQLSADANNDHGVVVVSESVARTLWPGRSAIGQSLWVPTGDNVAWREVIGIVRDIQFHAVGESPGMHIFVPYSQTPIPAVRLLVKGTTDRAAVYAAIRVAVQAAAPGSRIDQVATLDELVSRASAQPRFTTATVSAFGLLALVLASLGIYGTLSFIIAARTREIAIRVSLGGSSTRIIPGVLRRGLTPVFVGWLIGVVVAAAIARTFASLFFQLPVLDPTAYAVGTTLLLIAAFVATLAPVMRALRVEPSTLLRAE